MASSGEPPEEAITTLCEILGLVRTEAISRLKANGNDISRATDDFFENPDGSKYKWDESHFNTDREGETNTAGISFNIQGADELAPVSYVHSAAPTRPPSRTNNRSPLGRMIDFTAQEAAGAPTNSAQEDADLARAIAESAAESGLPPQEAGVIDNETNTKYFGPANRSQYDSDQWAMVPTKAMVETEQTDPPPSNRKRDTDAPAFLRQTKDHRLGALLSIYSKIPVARNFLLRCGKPARTYGHNTEWWKGKPILKEDVLATIARQEEVWGENAHPDFVEELHRLIAFLDKSERSYGNADGLAETKAIDDSFGSWMPDVEERLFHALHIASADDPECGVEDMTTTSKIISVRPPGANQSDLDSQDEDEEESTTSFIFLDIVLDPESYSWVNTIYDALDHLLWFSALSWDYTFPDEAKSAVLLKPAEVLTMRFGSGGLVKPCEIPAVFYADRYMDDRKDLALHFQIQIREIKSGLRKLTLWSEERVKCTGKLGCSMLQGLNQMHDVRECCTKLIEYAERLIERQKKDARWRRFQNQWEKDMPYSMDDLRLIHTWTGPFEMTDEEKTNQERWEYIIQLAKDKIEDAHQELAECERKKEELMGYLEVVRKRLTCQEHEADDDLFVFRSHGDAYRPEYWNPSKEYSLRGVALTHELSYVCVREAVNSTNLLDTPAARDQWWKIGYVASDASPIKSEKVTLDDVLQAAGTEAKNPILIYASEAAIQDEPIPLSDALRMFVKADNRSFQQELAQESSSSRPKHQSQELQVQDQPTMGVTAATLSQIPSEPRIKRKHSVGSSIATNGSIRSDLADIDLTFDEPEIVHDEDVPMALHQEHASSNSRSSKLGGIVESLAKCQTHESEAAALRENRETRHGGHEYSDQNSMVMQNSDAALASTSKMPEMSERKGGITRIWTRSDPAAQSPIEIMDLDTEEEAMGG
ncbi:hypothetical protein F5Y19DRAFT_350962 [Xylariaceae sp. FL1651]|nr:hypothetical protein F5Y19DRAFT_350962 [Xylariaceae sp. FL1651]